MTSNYLLSSMRIIAFEGLNGSGKSSAIQMLNESVIECGKSVKNVKIAGFGKSKRVQELYPLMQELELRRKKDLLTDTEYIDYCRNKIIRLTINIQIEEYRNEIANCIDKPDIVLMDRTPMVSWVYSSTIRLEKYLDEILQEAVDQTESLEIDDIVVLDVEPWISYARTFLRSINEGENIYSLLTRLKIICKQMKLTDVDMEKIMAYVKHFFFENISSRLTRPLDLQMSYEEVAMQREKYKEVGLHIKVPNSTHIIIINAMNNIEEVVSEIKSKINISHES